MTVHDTHRIHLLMVTLMLAVGGCASSAPRYTDRPATAAPAASTEQSDELAGELLVAPPERGAKEMIAARPEAVLPMAGVAAASAVPTVPVELPPAADTTRVFTPPPMSGPRKEYQVQVAITPSADEAEEFQQRLEPLLEGEAVFIVFTRPYYRIRVGHKTDRPAAEELLQALNKLGYENAMIIPVTVTPPPAGDVH